MSNQGSPPKQSIIDSVSSEEILSQCELDLQNIEKQEEQSNVDILQNLGFSTVQLDLQQILSKSLDYEQVTLFLLANLARLAEYYSFN